MGWEPEWTLRDQEYYDFLRKKYGNRKRLMDEAELKRAAVDKMKESDPHYHRAVVTAQQAQICTDMAYIIDRNTILESQLGHIEELFTRLGILEGAYMSLKIGIETCRLQSVTKPAKPAKEQS